MLILTKYENICIKTSWNLKKVRKIRTCYLITSWTLFYSPMATLDVTFNVLISTFIVIKWSDITILTSLYGVVCNHDQNEIHLCHFICKTRKCISCHAGGLSNENYIRSEIGFWFEKAECTKLTDHYQNRIFKDAKLNISRVKLTSILRLMIWLNLTKNS